MADSRKRFSLRTMFLFTLLCAIIAGVFVQLLRLQREAKERAEKIAQQKSITANMTMLEMESLQLQSKFGAGHPTVRGIDMQIQWLKTQLESLQQPTP